MAKTCNECGKVFGFLEKIYMTDDERRLCVDCVKQNNEQKQDDAVMLQDTPQEPQQVQQYVSLSPESSSDKWEFRVTKLSVDPGALRKGAVTIEKFEETINRMGEDGWELVSVVPLNVMLMQKESVPQPAMIFKRKK